MYYLKYLVCLHSRTLLRLWLQGGTLVIVLFLIGNNARSYAQKKRFSDAGYVYCPLQNVQLVQTGDKKLDNKRKRKQVKYTKNRKAFLLFYIDFFDELEKDTVDMAKILKHFEPDAAISYKGTSFKKATEFIKYIAYLNSYTTDDDYIMRGVQCGGKKKIKTALTCEAKGKTVTWWFGYSRNHKIKSFKETIAVTLKD